MSGINLKQLSENIKTQDSRSTSSPFYCIYELESVFIDSEYSSRFKTEYVWVSDEGCDFTKDDKEFESLNFLCDGDEITVDGTRYNKSCRSLIPRFVTACFTEAGANDYLDADGHNLNRPYIHVHSLNRNAEMIGLRNHLSILGESDS